MNNGDACYGWKNLIGNHTVLLRYIHIPTNRPFELPSDFSRFRCVVIQDRTVGGDFRWEVAQLLIEAGCVFMSAKGQDAPAWEDALHYAHEEKWGTDVSPEEWFCMTTSHEDADLGDVFAYIKRQKDITNTDFEGYLVLDFCEEERFADVEKAYLTN